MIFCTDLTVPIDSINYGGHLAHDKLLTLMHEARLRFFDQLEQSEENFFGVGLIVKSLAVNYRQQAFRGDILTFAISVAEVCGAAFTMHYEISRQNTDRIADADMVLVGFDYDKHRPARLPKASITMLHQYPNE